MITIHHLYVSQSDRVVWLMEELGLPYNLKCYQRKAEDNTAPDEYLALHPAATSPIIEDGALMLCESNAIVEYICHKYGDGRLVVPPSAENYADYLYWMQFNSNNAAVFIAELALRESATPNSAVQKIVLRRREGYYQHINNHLGKHRYLAGDSFSCADIMSVFVLAMLPLFGGRTVDDLPHVKRYLADIRARPAYIKAMKIAWPNT
ncbi:glutathione S-transferase family protein [Pectobacterium polaris]|uniref:glutathione S-transferase family protein n=1 Tax=Pectobacterium polaris TaxID=2042057 RepID=UPI00202D98BE|nr:glutathione S-transferase family protein [Pectobacterium polaris]MCL6324405.1 glutathione S-transferase family protein [Pectobacterium polaris]